MHQGITDTPYITTVDTTSLRRTEKIKLTNKETTLQLEEEENHSIYTDKAVASAYKDNACSKRTAVSQSILDLQPTV
jgi:hypothetical protein